MARLTLLLPLALALLLLLHPAAASPYAPHAGRQADQTAAPTAAPEESPELSPEESPDASPLPEDDEVCVDARYLAAHPAHTLVHRVAPLARVLCPPGGLPCATPHHLLRVDGRPVSYRQLCERDGAACTQQTMKVNSVLSHRWVDVPHGDAMLTMYDARHPEFPQRALHFAVEMKRRVIG